MQQGPVRVLSILVASSLGHGQVWQVKRLRNTLTKWFGVYCVCGRGLYLFGWFLFMLFLVSFLKMVGFFLFVMFCALFCFSPASGRNQHNYMRKYNDEHLALSLWNVPGLTMSLWNDSSAHRDMAYAGFVFFLQSIQRELPVACYSVVFYNVLHR